ncbi:MAG: phosphate ABC transporter substrate-binding protein [Phycisphaerae bacterium]|jgi:phosphate transport system substrate-binding protein|nr:MAG: phosphate ABC transporter substrate-binding protein [Phycisphaerae bacterium]
MFASFKSLALAVVAATTLAGSAWAQQKVVIDGSSTVYPVTEAVAEEFGKEKKGQVQVTVGISGTGGGFKKFVRGETDISNASRPILQKEMDEAKKNGIEYIELPIAFDALTVVVNKENTWCEQLTIPELRTIWSPESEGKITRWNQVNPSFPDAPLKLFGAGPDSGTFDYFTEAVNGKSKASRKDYTPTEDDNVTVQGVSQDKNAIGYFGLAYYEENKDKLKAVKIVNAQGKAVYPTVESAKSGEYNPLSRPIFIYVNKKSLETKPQVREFVEFYLKHGGELAKEVGYVPLPEEGYKMAAERVSKGETGTVFGGKESVGMTIEKLFTLERVH